VNLKVRKSYFCTFSKIGSRKNISFFFGNNQTFIHKASILKVLETIGEKKRWLDGFEIELTANKLFFMCYKEYINFPG